MTRTVEVQAPDTPFYELVAHTKGEPGRAAMTLWCHEREQAARHLEWWRQSGAYDVTLYHVTKDGRTRLHPEEAVA